jgi:acetolactate synthase-1/2/3 large subunit
MNFGTSKETLSDALAEEFWKLGIRDVFLVTGGAIAGFTNALASHKGFNMHYMLTEQSAGIAAESYGFLDGHPALLVVTSGPGVTNALTPVAAAWANSSPVIVVSGQARVKDVNQSKIESNRQIGNQHLRTDLLVTSIVKKFEEPLIEFVPQSLATRLFEEATSGRPGPVWLSLPNDLQRISINQFKSGVSIDTGETRTTRSIHRIPKFENFIKSEKPLMLIGNGARKNIEAILKFSEFHHIPISTTWPGMDLVPQNHPLYVGRPGTIPSSWLPNLAVQNCTNLLILGVRLDLGQVGYNPEYFASQAEVIRIDIDREEFIRIPPRANWTNICEDIANVDFKEYAFDISLRKSWLEQISDWGSLPGPLEIKQEFDDGASTYAAIEMLSKCFTSGFVVTGSSGTCVEMTLQSWQVGESQRIINSCGIGSMGFGLAASIGVSIKLSGQEVLCIESDGSLQMNIQDLAYLSNPTHRIKLVVLDSGGYKSISLSQVRQGQISHGNSAVEEIDYLNLERILSGLGIPFQILENDMNLETAGNWLANLSVSGVLIIKVSQAEEALPRLISTLNIEGKMTTPKMDKLSPSSTFWN